MITYNRSAFGVNLIFRIYGSAVYRSVVPSILAVAFYYLIHNLDYGKLNGDELGHPYAVGVLVGSTTFLVVFRVNQGYSRYWEAAGNAHQMMSKWMDATIHTAVYHLQCSHYDDIKPPSYFEYPELNAMFLTRDRERGRPITPNDSFDMTDDPEEEPLKTFKRRSQLSSRKSRRINTRNFEKMNAEERERAIRSVTKSINAVEDLEKLARLGLDEQPPISGHRVELDPSVYANTGKDPLPLYGPGRLDGNWGALFDDDKATFCDPNDPDKYDPKGFASYQGGRTAPLFLQELAHLSSLLSAVACATLRNDIDGAESPLDFYHPGSPWPPVDPDKDEWLKVNGFQALLRNFCSFLGMGPSNEERTRYNAARPLPVIGGVSDYEIRFLQKARGPYAKTQLCWYWLSEFCIREHLAGSTGNVGPPIISRVVQFLSDGMIYYNQSRKIMFVPFPFVHSQVSVVFVWVMVPVIPFLIDQYTSARWVATFLTFFTVLCLVAIHEVARELENPFRNVPNELPLVTMQAQYNEALLTMFSGYHPDHYWDADRILRKRAAPKTESQVPKPEETQTMEDPSESINWKPEPLPRPRHVRCISDSRIRETRRGSFSERDEIAKLQRQLEDQAKLIALLADKVKFDPAREIERIEAVLENGYESEIFIEGHGLQ